ncbi:hypothetical protein R5O26_07365 [Oenococcus oeni]
MTSPDNNQNKVHIKCEKKHFSELLKKLMTKHHESIYNLVEAVFGNNETYFLKKENKDKSTIKPVYSTEYMQISNWKRGKSLPDYTAYLAIKKHYQDKGEQIHNFEFLYSNTPQKYINDFFSSLIAKIKFTYSPKLIDHSEENKKEAADINEFSLKYHNDNNFESLLQQHIADVISKREINEKQLEKKSKKGKNKQLTKKEIIFKNQFALFIESFDLNFLIEYEKGGRVLKHEVLISAIKNYTNQNDMNKIVHLEKINDNDIQHDINTIIISRINEKMKQQRSVESWSMEGKAIKLYRDTLHLMSAGSQQAHQIKNITINQIEKNIEIEDTLEKRKKLIDSQSDIIFDSLLEEFQNKLSEKYFKLKELKESLH